MGHGTRRADERRKALLEAATELFMTHGYTGTSLQMVIDKAGGSRRSIYQSFTNKEGLFLAAVDAQLDRIVEKMTRPLTLDGVPQQVLTDLGTAFVQALLNPQAIAIFRIVIAEVRRFPECGRLVYAKGPARAYALVSGYLDALNRKGVTDIVDSAIAARQLLEMMKGDLHLRALLEPDRPITRTEIEQHIHAAVTRFLMGYQRR